MDSGAEFSVEVPECPDACEKIEARIRETADTLIKFVHKDTNAFRLYEFERALMGYVWLIFRLGVALFLARRHQHLDLSTYTDEGWRVSRRFAVRTIKTMCGEVKYGRAYLTRLAGGWFPLDAQLGITQDGFSWQVIDVVTRLATQVSYSAARSMMKIMLG